MAGSDRAHITMEKIRPQTERTEWIIVEQETYPDGKSPMECTQMSLAGLKTVLAGLAK